MKYIRYRYRDTVSYGILAGDTVKAITGELFRDYKPSGPGLNIGEVDLLCPCEPGKIFAVGLNYRSHLGERPAPKEPAVFNVPTSALLEPEGVIRIPPDAKEAHYEGELVAVIGNRVKNVTPVEAADAIFGFTCGNDISERLWQRNDLQWWRAKGCDTFAPLGPCIAAGYDWSRGGIRTLVNGEVVQEGFFSELLFDPPTIVSYISRYVTLYPGDVVYTGTPGDTHSLRPGDTVEVVIDGIGSLINTVR